MSERDTQPPAFDCRPLKAPFGAEVLDVDLAQIEAPTDAALLAALAEYGLLLFRRQSSHDNEIYRFSAALGPVEASAAALPTPGRALRRARLRGRRRFASIRRV